MTWQAAQRFRGEQAQRAAARRRTSRKVDAATLEQAIARARNAAENPRPEDPVEARVAELEEELEANGEKRLTPWRLYADGALRCEVRRADGKRGGMTAWLPSRSGTEGR